MVHAHKELSLQGQVLFATIVVLPAQLRRTV